MSEAEKCPVTDDICHLPVMLVVMFLLHRLGLLQTMADVGEEGVTFLHVPGYGSDSRLTGLIRANGRRVTAVDHPKRSLAEREMVRGVVDVLGPR